MTAARHVKQPPPAPTGDTDEGRDVDSEPPA
jgi:hypothetical protein